MGIHDHFRRKYAKHYELALNTDLSPDIQVGTVGQLRWGKKFTEAGLPDLQELGVGDIPLTDPGPPGDRLFTHTGDNEFSFGIKAAGDPPGEGSKLSEASAGVSLSFGKKWSYMLATKGLRYQALDITPEFSAKLQALGQAGKLKPSWEFVVGVWTAESVSWALSLRRSTTFEAAASAEVASLADLEVDWSVKNGGGTVDYLKAQRGPIPIAFQLARLRRNGQVHHLAFLGAESFTPSYANESYVYELVRPSDLLGDDDDDA